MTTVLDLAEKVLSLAAEKPDYVYDSPVVNYLGDTVCTYLDPKDPTKGSCLVGQAAIACGVPPEVLAHWEGSAAISLLDNLLSSKALDGWDDELARAIDATQSLQDMSEPWGAAVEESGLASLVSLTKELRALDERTQDA